MRAHQGDVIIRTNLVTLPLHDRQGVRLDALAHLRTLQVGQCGHWPVWVKADGPPDDELSQLLHDRRALARLGQGRWPWT